MNDSSTGQRPGPKAKPAAGNGRAPRTAGEGAPAAGAARSGRGAPPAAPPAASHAAKDPRGVRPARHAASNQRLANVIAIASGKGGVGKTWLSVTLALTCAKKGERVLLFDGDIGLANVDIQLGLMPRHDLGEVLEGRRRLGEAITTYEEGGMDVVAGKSGSGTLAGLPRNRLEALRDEIAELAGQYDRVILDLGAGLDLPVRLLSGLAALNLIVTTDEPTALTDAYALMKLVTTKDPKVDLRLVINQAKNQQEGRRTYDKLNRACSSFLKLSPRLAGIVHDDPHVADSIRHQQSILSRHPNSVATLDIEMLRSSLLRTAPGAPPQPLPDATGG
ncbi:MAG: MinD/ParA family protein [Sneathiellaceae bacterium]